MGRRPCCMPGDVQLGKDLAQVVLDGARAGPRRDPRARCLERKPALHHASALSPLDLKQRGVRYGARATGGPVTFRHNVGVFGSCARSTRGTDPSGRNRRDELRRRNRRRRGNDRLPLTGTCWVYRELPPLSAARRAAIAASSSPPLSAARTSWRACSGVALTVMPLTPRRV